MRADLPPPAHSIPPSLPPFLQRGSPPTPAQARRRAPGPAQGAVSLVRPVLVG